MAFETFPSTNLSSQMAAQATDTGAGEKKAEEPPKESGLLSEVFGDRKERTLAGCAIGTVRDAFSGKLTEEEKVKRAEGNEFVATIAADTAAMMSKKVAVGGLVRATMMADTKGNARDFTLGFVKDGLEGVGLNYIGKMAQPGSRAYNFAGSRLGVGLKQEISLHAGSGAMFGALKAGADPMAWRDKDGHFSFQSGLNNLTDWKKMSTATLTGAVINVPAGMIGFRIAKSSTLSVANRTGSEALGTVTGGVLSGGGSGAVFGGLDAVVHGKSLGEIGRSTFDGMLIGAGTGGVMSGFHVLRPGAKPQHGETGENQQQRQSGDKHVVERQPAEKNVTERQPAEKLATATALESDLPSMSDASRAKLSKEFEYILPEEIKARMFAAHDTIAYVPEPKLGVGELHKRLTLQPSTEISVTRVKKGVELPETFNDLKDFLKWTETTKEPARVYRVQGSQTQIIIPESYAKKLDQLRILRHWAEMDAPSFDNLPGDTRRVMQKEVAEGRRDLLEAAFGDKADTIAKIIDARVKLTTIPANRRALPEDFIQAVQSLPNPGMVKELVLMDEPYYRDVYKEKGEGNSMPAAANANEEGRIVFFEADNTLPKGSTASNKIHEFLTHEWAHLVKFKFKEVSSLFNEAAEIETGFYSRDYAKRQYPDHPDLKHHENFAVHLGENLMMPDADNFFSVAHHAPIRTSLMARGWLESMMGAKQKMTINPADFVERINEIPTTVANRDMHVARLKYIAEEIVPIARQRLLEQVASGNLSDRLRAAMILGRIGHPSDVPFAEHVLRTTTEPQIKKALFSSIVNISDRSPDARLSFLIENAKPGHPLRDVALEAMSGYQHPEARAYYDALRLSASEANLPELMSLIERTPVTGAKKMAFESVLKLSKSAPHAEEFLQTYLLKVLRSQPDLRIEALNEAVKRPSMELELEAVRLQRVSDKQVAARAKQAAAEFKTVRSINQYKQWINGSDQMAKYQAIQELGWLNDHRAIPVLLEVFAAGQPKWSREAAIALSHYNANVVAVAAHQLQRNGSPVRWGDVQQQLRALD